MRVSLFKDGTCESSFSFESETFTEHDREGDALKRLTAQHFNPVALMNMLSPSNLDEKEESKSQDEDNKLDRSDAVIDNDEVNTNKMKLHVRLTALEHVD